jgi:hypothetical protein
MADFIDFVAACARDPKLGKEFISNIKGKSAKDLAGWFKGKGYDITDSDASKIAANSDAISQIESGVRSY